VPRDERAARFDEALPLVRRLWTEDHVDHDGGHFHYRDLTVRPKPVQRPLDVWLGGRAPSELRRCGRLGDGWLAGPGATGANTYSGVIDTPSSDAQITTSGVVQLAGWFLDRTADGWAGADDVEGYLGTMGNGGARLAHAFRQGMLLHGVDLTGLSGMTTAAHTETDVEQTIAAVAGTLDLLREEGLS